MGIASKLEIGDEDEDEDEDEEQQFVVGKQHRRWLNLL